MILVGIWRRVDAGGGRGRGSAVMDVLRRSYLGCVAAGADSDVFRCFATAL